MSPGPLHRMILQETRQDRMAKFEEWISKNDIQVEDDLPEGEKLDMQMFAYAFSDAFTSGSKPGLMKGVEFGIDFKEPFVRPFKERIRCCSPAETAAKVVEVEKMQGLGVVGRSNSPWASNVVMAKKKDGSWRFCTD